MWNDRNWDWKAWGLVTAVSLFALAGINYCQFTEFEAGRTSVMRVSRSTANAYQSGGKMATVWPFALLGGALATASAIGYLVQFAQSDFGPTESDKDVVLRSIEAVRQQVRQRQSLRARHRL